MKQEISIYKLSQLFPSSTTICFVSECFIDYDLIWFECPSYFALTKKNTILIFNLLSGDCPSALGFEEKNGRKNAELPIGLQFDLRKHNFES